MFQHYFFGMISLTSLKNGWLGAMNVLQRLKDINNFLEDKKILAYGIVLLYFCLLCFTSYYHEPWHDEGQAWLIARDDSLWHLLTYTTHLEGHPPLWHLFLMPFAKVGVPFEVGLKSVNILFCTGAIWLLTVKSPLPWYWRFFLPFTYFFFYQFGVINRTYSLLMFAMMLAAYYYPQKLQKPFCLAGSLILLSGSQAYGMMIACGIACAWFLDIVNELRTKGCKITISRLWQEPACKALLLLFVVASFWALTMVPFHNTAFTNLQNTHRGSFLQNLFFCFFVMPAQLFCEIDIKDTIYDQSFSFFLTTINKYLDMARTYGYYAYLIIVETLLKYLYGPMVQLILGYISFALGLGWLFVLPEIFFFILASLVFLRTHHIGILACFYVFMLWQIYAKPECLIKELKEKFRGKFTSQNEYGIIQTLIYGVLAGIFLINLQWIAKDISVEVTTPYDVSRNVATYIKTNKMENLRFWVIWSYLADNKKISMGAYDINAYFTKPFIENLNGGFTKYGFLEYRVWEKEKFENNLRKMGPPDLILDDVPVEKIFNQYITYVPIQRFDFYRPVKQHVDASRCILYLRQDLLPFYPQVHVLKHAELDRHLQYFN